MQNKSQVTTCEQNLTKALEKYRIRIAAYRRDSSFCFETVTWYVAEAGLELACSSDWPFAHTSHVLAWCLEWSDEDVNHYTGPKT